MKNARASTSFNEIHQIYLFYLIPLFFLIGRASIDIVITYIGLNFFFKKIIIDEDYSIFDNKIFQTGLFFCCVQILISFFSTNLNVSIFKSLTYLRFIFFFGATTYFIKSNYFKINYFYYAVGICTLFLNIDIVIQYLLG